MQSNASEKVATIGLRGVAGDIIPSLPLGSGDAMVSLGVLLFLEWSLVGVTGE